MGGVEQSDWCYSRPTGTHVLATGALYAEEKKSVIPYKAEHAASKKERKKKNHHTLFARREIAHGAERPRSHREPTLPRGKYAFFGPEVYYFHGLC